MDSTLKNIHPCIYDLGERSVFVLHWGSQNWGSVINRVSKNSLSYVVFVRKNNENDGGGGDKKNILFVAPATPPKVSTYTPPPFCVLEEACAL
mmetsp:Transcript_37172/g.54438  ORF Transcript_37172/g.54438 Transcript_37172/m.54438 type:complete len:93 (-) Transcript_37172:13-291(-)